MEEVGKEEGEQIYDDIEDTEEGKPNRNGEFLTSRRRAAAEESSATTANISAPTEATGDKKNILHKLRNKFRPRKSTEDFTNIAGSHETSDSWPVAYASIDSEDELPTTTKRPALKNTQKTFSFSGFAKGRFAGASQAERSRSKTFTSGIHGKFEEEKTREDMFNVPKEAAGASCAAYSRTKSCLFDAHEVPFVDSARKRAFSYHEDVPPPIPPHSRIIRKEQWRERAKSLSLSPDETSVSDKSEHANTQKQANKVDEPSHDNTKCQTATSGTELSLTRSLETLSHYSWYWGPINRYEAEDKLKGKPDGSFLVRDSCHEFHLYSVSFRSRGRTCHTRIRYEDGRFGFLTPTGLMGTKTVVGLIKRSIRISQKGVLCFSNSPGFLDTPHPIRFTTPVSRFEDLPSLQHLCRFVIRQNSRCDKLHELPLPPKLIDYLDVENHFLENK
ncbi:suppressor of cytokine signaling 6-like [Orbicella faveolata]|uniref:suppressor of cytokine signaling 6-like n=1 Tax=Orbicella faveolata TaxID=48498 RepID=UPI0009E2B9B0|nr:suppressor of cytokine signaling 6-like [Orbicella faveolata]